MFTVTSSQYPQKLKLISPTTYSYSNTILPLSRGRIHDSFHSERALVELLSFFMIFFKREREKERESISGNLTIQQIFASLIAKFNLVLLILGSESREGKPKGQIAYLL